MEKRTSILSLSDEQIGKMVRALFTIQADFVTSTFGLSSDLPLTPKKVVEVLRSLGMDQYASQLYILVGGLYLGAHPTHEVFDRVKEWRAAFELAERLDVPVDTILPAAARKYLEGKGTSI